MIINKSDKIDYDKIISTEVGSTLSEKAKIVLKEVVRLKNSGETDITNDMISNSLEYTSRQVVGIMNGVVKKGILIREKAEVQVTKEVTVFRFNKKGDV